MPIKKTKLKKSIRKRGGNRFIQKNRLMPNSVHNFKFKAYTPNWLGVTMDGEPTYFSRDFSLEDLPASLELVALFDLYRINKIVFKATPRYSSNLIYQTAAFTNPTIENAGNTDAGGTNLLGASNMGLPSLITVIDFDDVATPASTIELFEYSNVKKTLGSRDHVRTFVPRIKVDPAVTDLSVARKWVSTSNAELNHYGIKGCVENVPDLPEQGGLRPIFYVDLEVTMYISMRNTK